MKIYHISDIHLTKSFISDWKNYIQKAFVEYVNQTKDLDSIIVCTGDLVDKGGRDWDNIEMAFNAFRDDFISPILAATGITMDRFVICPGNHDIERGKDQPYVQLGVRSLIKEKGTTEIMKYSHDILEGNYETSNRIREYNRFVKSLYSGYDNVLVSNLGIAFRFIIDGQRVGIAAFNSVWDSCDDQDREYGLAIGEPQYNQLREALLDCDVRIAAIHHPLDWFSYEGKTVIHWMVDDYNLILMGHIHQNDTGMSQKPSGTYAYNISPSFSSDIRGESRTYVNGFTAIDLSSDSQDVVCHYLVFDIQTRGYKLNTDYSEDGVFEFTYRRDGANMSALITRCLKQIETDFFPRIDESLIPQRARAIHSIDDAFVMPPLRRNGDDSQTDYPLSAILNGLSNIVLFGNSESGKTVLLYKCLKEFVLKYSVYQRIPVYLDFAVNTNQDFETQIKCFLSCNTKELNRLIDNGKLLLLVDNYSVAKEYKERKSALYHFLAEKPIRMIATVAYELSDTIPMSFVNENEISVESFFIHQFSAEKVKELMEKWSPEDDSMKRISKIEKMVDKFCSYSLPCSAMSVSLYLWCTEDSSRAPINSAYLLDIYLEIILEKLSLENVYRDSFNYNNKCNLLSYIAYNCNKNLMEDPEFVLSKGMLISMTEDYLKSVGHNQFQADRIVDYFIGQRIFIQEGNNIHYAHACFFYFFLAKRMITNKSFREEVMSRENYFKYERVLDYYSGLVMSDKEWLEELLNRFEDYFSNAYDIIQQIDIDDFFTKIVIGDNGKRFMPIAARIAPAKIVSSKPTIKEVEKQTLAVSDDRLSHIKDKISREGVLSMSSLLVMMSKALRNMENLEDLALKQRVYNSIIRNALVYNVITKDYLAFYANNHKGELPPSLADVKDVYTFLRFLPFIFQFNLFDIIGTPKLLSIYEAKLNKDIASNRSDVEKYMSLAMMWDTANVKYAKEYRKILRSVGNNSVQDYLLMKLLYYFRNRVVLGSDAEDVYIDLIAEAKVKVERLGRFKKGTVIKQMKDEQKRLLRDRGKES